MDSRQLRSDSFASVARQKALEDKEDRARARARRSAHVTAMAEKKDAPRSKRPKMRAVESVGDDIINGLTGLAYEDKMPIEHLQSAQVLDVVLSSLADDTEVGAALRAIESRVLEASHACETEKISLRRVTSAFKRQNFTSSDEKTQAIFYALAVFLRA